MIPMQKRPVKVLIWEVESGRKVHTFGASLRGRAVVFSPDGKLADVSTGTKVIDLWQVAG